MRFELHSELQQRLEQEAAHPDTIFLYRYGKGWLALGNSAILLQRYFAPVWLRMGEVGTEKVPYVIWEGTISPRKSSEARAFQFSCEGEDQMTISCSEPLALPVPKLQAV